MNTLLNVWYLKGRLSQTYFISLNERVKYIVLHWNILTINILDTIFLLLLSDVTDPRITGSRFKRPMDNKIFFEAVQTSDPMVIQCNASNIHGYVFADVYLNVLCKSLNVLYKFVCNLVCVQMCF